MEGEGGTNGESGMETYTLLLLPLSHFSCVRLCATPSLGLSRQEHLSGLPFFQCMKVKSESEVAQSCLTLRNPMDCSLPGSSVHGVFQARVLEWGAIAFSNIYTTIYKREPVGICCGTQGTQTGALWQQRGGMGWKVGGRFKTVGTHVYVWLIHVDVRQKPTQYCKIIIL